MLNGDVETRWATYEDIEHKTVSYAQNAEDILLNRVFGKGYRGFYVDIGANDPVFHSVTKLLYDGGWKGINVEPTPSLFQKLSHARGRDINLNVGVSNAEGFLTFYEVAPPLHGWSTFMPEMAAAYHNQGVATTERTIEVKTLEAIFSAHVNQSVDVLKIDVEGLEQKVVASLDWNKWNPKIVLVEATWSDLWEHMLLSAEYLKVAFDGINNYYVKQENEELINNLRAPVNVLDNFVSHELLRLLNQRSHTLEVLNLDVKSLNPTVLKIAQKIQSASRRHPALASVVKKILKGVI